MQTEKVIKARLNEERCELHYECGGLWNSENIDEMFGVLGKTSMPLLKAGRPIYAVGDYSKAIPQDRATAEKISQHLDQAAKAGFKRSAIVGASALFKLQYKRVAKSVEVEFFDTESEAIAWLRADR